jgi:hypothetical protein
LAAGRFGGASELDVFVDAVRLAAAFLAGVFLAAAFLAGFFLAAIRLTSRQIWTPDSSGSIPENRSSRSEQAFESHADLVVGDAVDLEVLRARCGSDHDANVASTDAEGDRDQLADLVVGGAVHRWRRHRKARMVTVPTGEARTTCARLNPDGEAGHRLSAPPA